MNASLTDFKLPRQEQHERVFLDDAIKKYKTRRLTAAGFIDTICRIYRAEGHRLNIPKPRQFYEYFGIPKSTFYRALIQLAETPEIGFNWEPIGGISIWWGKPAAASVEPAAASVEPQRFNQIPPLVRDDFEAFVRSGWKRIKGEEIRSFHRFVEKAADFQSWWEKFKARPISNTQSTNIVAEPLVTSKAESAVLELDASQQSTHIVAKPLVTPELAINSERMSADKFRQLRQLALSKK